MPRQIYVLTFVQTLTVKKNVSVLLDFSYQHQEDRSVTVTSYKINKQGRSQDFHQGGAQLVSEVLVVHGEAAHSQLCWP